MIYKLALLTLLTCCYATPPPGYVKPPDVDEYPPKYEYGYNIEDNKGSGQGKSESRDGVFSLGRYYVQLGEGQKGASQNVQYVTDEWGYHPVVQYSSVGEHSQASAQFALGETAVEALRKHNNNPNDVKEQIKQTAETVTPSPIPSTASLIGQGQANSVQEETIAPTAGQENVPSPPSLPTPSSPSAVQRPQQPTLPFQVFLQPVHIPHPQFLIQPQALAQQSKFLIPVSNHPQMQYAIPFYPTGITRFKTGYNYQHQHQHVPQAVAAVPTTQQAKIEQQQQQRDEQHANGQQIEQNVNAQQQNVNQQSGEQNIKQDTNQQLREQSIEQNINQQIMEQNINQQLREQNINQQLEQNINQQIREQNMNQQIREQNINQQLEQNINQQIMEQQINQQIEQNINQQLKEQQLNQQIREQNINQQLEQNINQQIREQNINQQLKEQQLNQQIREQQLNQQIREQNKDTSQEQGIEQLIENVQLDLQKENAVEKQNGGEVANKFTVQINSEQYGGEHVRTGVFNMNNLEQISQLKTATAEQQNEHQQSVINTDVVQQQNGAQQANNNAYISSEIGEKNLEGILNLEINKYKANENNRDEKNAVNFIIHNGAQQNVELAQQNINLNAGDSGNQNEQKSVYETQRTTQQGLEQNQQNAGTYNQNVGYVTSDTDERHIEQTLKAAYISAQDSVANNQLQHVEYTNGGNNNYKESNSNEQIQLNQNYNNNAQQQQYYQKELKTNNAANVQYNSGAETHNNGQFLVEVTPTTNSISFKNQNIDQSRQEQYTNQQITESAKENDLKQLQYIQQSLQDDSLKNNINVNVDQNLNIQNTEALFGTVASEVKYNSNSLNQHASYDESILSLENPGGYGSKINGRRPNVVNQHYEHTDQTGNRGTSGNNNHAGNNKFIDQSRNQATQANGNYEATNNQVNYQVSNNNYIAANNNYQSGNNGNYEASNIKYETGNINTDYGTTSNNYEINTKLIDRTRNLVTGVDVLNINDAVGHNEDVIYNQLAKENHMINQYKAGNIQYGYNVNIPNTILQVVSGLNEFNDENVQQTAQQQSQQENLQAVAELQQINGNKLVSNTNLQQDIQQVSANEYANSESGTVQSSIQISPDTHNFPDQNFAITQLYQQSNALNSAANGQIHNARNNLLQILNAERILPAREENRISFADKPIVVAELENFPQHGVQSTTEFYRHRDKAIDESTYSTTQNTVETKITANSYESTESPIVITPRPVSNNFLAPITAAVTLQTSEQQQQQQLIQEPRPSGTYVQIQKSVPYYLGKVEYIENQQNGFVQHSKEQALFNTKLFLQNQAQEQQTVQVASRVEEINDTPRAAALIQSTKNHNNLFVQDQKQENDNIQQLSTGYDLQEELSNASQELTSAEIDGSVEESKIVNKPSQQTEYEENISVTLSRNPPRAPYLVRKENSNEDGKSGEETVVEKPVAVHVAHPYPVEVEKIVEKQVQVPVAVPYLVEKRIPVEVERFIDRPVQITRIVEKPVAVHVPQPYPVAIHKVVEKPIPVPVEVTRYVNKPYPVHIPYPQPIAIPVQVERLVQKFVDKPYPVKVPVRVEVPVKVPVIQRVPVTKYVDRTVTVEKIVEKPVTVEKIVEKPVTKYIDKPYPVPVHVAVPHPIAVPVEIKVPQPYPVEVTKYIQRPYGVPQPYPVHVPKSAPYIQQVQYPVTKLVQVPVEVPQYVDRVVDRPYPVYVDLQEQYKNQQNPYMYAPKYQVDWKHCIRNQHKHIARAVKSHEYVGLVPPLKSATVFSNGSTQQQQQQQQQQEQQHQKNYKRKARNSFEQSLRLEYGFKPPIIPSVQTDEFGMPLTKED